MTVLTNIREITDSQIKAGHSQIHTVLINLKDFQRHDTQQESNQTLSELSVSRIEQVRR